MNKQAGIRNAETKALSSSYMENGLLITEPITSQPMCIGTFNRKAGEESKLNPIVSELHLNSAEHV